MRTTIIGSLPRSLCVHGEGKQQANNCRMWQNKKLPIDGYTPPPIVQVKGRTGHRTTRCETRLVFFLTRSLVSSFPAYLPAHKGVCMSITMYTRHASDAQESAGPGTWMIATVFGIIELVSRQLVFTQFSLLVDFHGPISRQFRPFYVYRSTPIRSSGSSNVAAIATLEVALTLI